MYLLLTSQGILFRIGNGLKLTVTNVKIDGLSSEQYTPAGSSQTWEAAGLGWVTQDSQDNTTPVVYVYGNANSEFSMAGSAVISGNKNTSLPTQSAQGGAVRADGKLTMSGSASITGNLRTNTGGGGVYLRGYSSGLFTMSGSASITNNASTAGSGGGVYVEWGTFIMESGTSISGNLASSASGSASGGGVYAGGTNAKFLMNGGTISGNTLKYASSYNGFGGGVYVGSGTGFVMAGGAQVTPNASGTHTTTADDRNTICLPYSATESSQGVVLIDGSLTAATAGKIDLYYTSATSDWDGKKVLRTATVSGTGTGTTITPGDYSGAAPTDKFSMGLYLLSSGSTNSEITKTIGGDGTLQ